MRKNNSIILLSSAIAIAAVFSVSCMKQEFSADNAVPSAESLIGKKINFKPSLLEFTENGADTKATCTNYSDGSFNDADQMTIYREYWNGNKFENANSYRIYENELLSRMGWIINEGDEGKEGDYFVQGEEDVLVWESSQTIRFRAYSRSNLMEAITNDRSLYYPDFCVSDWVNSSGPSIDIPLELSHLGCRIAISTKNSGNNLFKVEICTDPADYMREDNAGTHAQDEADKVDSLTAQMRADSVRAIYNRMCMPSGVNIESGKSYAMSKAYYDDHTDMSKVDDEKETAAHVNFGILDSTAVRTSIQRPVFASPIKNTCYLISIPYDFSSHADIQGDQLVLPPYTRFRIYLYDVNNGDRAQSSSIEKTYHILSLSDIKDGDQPKFPDGLALKAGYSYFFSVGYRYDNLTVSLRDNLSWSKQDEQEIDGVNEIQDRPDTIYNWWQTTMNNAAAEALITNNFNPVFELNDDIQFASFIKLVNGTATDKTGNELKSAFTIVGYEKVTGWYTTITEDNDTLWLRVGKVDAPGFDSSEYIFYDHYHPQDGDVKAYVMEDYLSSAYSFYDPEVRKQLVINLMADLDLKDWKFTSIGTETTPFRGYFNGNAHKISNIYMTDGYMFGRILSAGIGNLFISSEHDVSVVNKSTGESIIVGISLKADSGNPSIINQIASGNMMMIGCINFGNSGRALVGTNSGHLVMYGCMQTSSGINGGALCENDMSGSLVPQAGTIMWANFMANYYDLTRSPSARAVGSSYATYRPQEYIRGAQSYVLKAKYDLGLPSSGVVSEAYYGVAPWRAMNSAIYKYNTEGSGKTCAVHYETSTSGYDNLYPDLVSGMPTEFIDITDEPN